MTFSGKQKKPFPKQKNRKYPKVSFRFVQRIDVKFKKGKVKAK